MAKKSRKATRIKNKKKLDQETEYIGFIADDVHDAGITELVVYDDKGEIDGFSYDKMTAVLTKAIQEQQTIIDDLKARIEKLEDA